LATLTTSSPTRREARRQLRRDTIVQVASGYFLEHGYAGTTMSGIAGALGGSKGTLWNHFPSKEELFVAVLDRLTEEFRAQLSLILSARQDIETALRRFCAEFLRKVTSVEGIALYRLVVSEANRFPEIGRNFHDRGPRVTQQQLAEFLADAMERGLLRRDDPLEAGRQLIGLCLSGSRQNLLIGLIDAVTPAEIDADINRAMAIFMRAYAVS
jgi:AcrR family transcriptional regulator